MLRESPPIAGSSPRRERSCYILSVSAAGFLLVLSVLALLLATTAWSGRAMPKELVGVLLYIAMLAVRPGLLGEIVGPIGGCLLLAVLYLVLLDGRVGWVTITGKQGWALSLCVLAPILLGGLRGAEALSGVLISPLVAAVGLLIAREHRILKGLSGATAGGGATESWSDGVEAVVTWIRSVYPVWSKPTRVGVLSVRARINFGRIWRGLQDL